MKNGTGFFFIKLICLSLLVSCDDRNIPIEELKESLTFYSSFDGNLEADFAVADPAFYMAPSWDERESFVLFEDEGGYMQIHENAGRYGDALWMDSEYEPVFFYFGEENMHYESVNWSGTISFWMRLDPEEDLRSGYSDPIQITPHAWNNGALFVDFTEEIPRIFRFAIFADRDVWDPEQSEWDEIPIEERPMVDVEDLPFNREDWTHVALSFRNFNTGQNDGVVDCYINGEKFDSLEGRDQTFTWNPEEVKIWLGYNYRGYFDELALFDRNLSDEEIYQLYTLENGVHDLIPD